MKLNNDCIRDTMLYLENCNYYVVNNDNDVEPKSILLENIYQNLNIYSKSEIYYTLINLEQAGFINLNKTRSNNALNCSVNFITFSGHEFLNSIKDANNWSKIQSCLNSFRNYSLAAIQAVAEGITAAAIQKYAPIFFSKKDS